MSACWVGKERREGKGVKLSSVEKMGLCGLGIYKLRLEMKRRGEFRLPDRGLGRWRSSRIASAGKFQIDLVQQIMIKRSLNNPHH